jgi:flagellar biosynthesis/type III secretory pathway M-ring protein FliF/YscJ
VAEQVIIQPVISETVIILFLFVVALFVVFLIVREVRIAKTASRKLEVDLERDKLKLLQQHAEVRAYPFTRLSPEQVGEIKKVEDDTINLETVIFAKERLIDTRLKRLENYVKQIKLDNMLGKIEKEENKVK